MADLIDRQAAIDVASGYCHPANIADELRKLPSEQLKQQWIPCNERLPEEKGYYLTAYSYMSGHIGYNVSRFAKDLYKVDEYDFAEWKGVSGFFTIDDEYGYVKVDALAWMPIEPWRGEEHETDHRKE